MNDDIEKLKRAVEFYEKALADPVGLEVGAVRDGQEWVLETAIALVKNLGRKNAPQKA